LGAYFAQKDIINSYPPDHGRMRAPVQRAMMPKVIAGMEAKTCRLANELFAQAVAAWKCEAAAEVELMFIPRTGSTIVRLCADHTRSNDAERAAGAG
jgi:cytochrome P450